MKNYAMKASVLAAWLAALRSGEYAQTNHALRLDKPDGFRGAGYCCLGVLADLAVKAGKASWATAIGHKCRIGEDSDLLPEVVAEWAGLKFINSPPDGGTGALINEMNDIWLGEDGGWISTQNDDGVPFTMIADLLEAAIEPV